MTILKSLAVAAAVSITASGAFAQEVTLRVQHFISNKGAIPANFIIPWGEALAEQSGGRIKVEIYPAMQLGGTPPELFDQVRDGVVDVGWTIPSYTAGRFPGVELMELPFMSGQSAEGTSKAAFEMYEKYLTEEFSEVKILAVHVHGSGVIHTKGVTIDSVDDFAGLKLRAPTRITSKILEALGSTVVGMPVPQLPEAISKGVVQGGVIPWEIVPPLKMHELAESHTTIGGDRALYNTFFVYAMNKRTYDNMPDDLKAIIDANSGMMASEWAGRAMDIGDQLGLKLTTDRGNNIVALEGADLEAIKAKTDPIIEEWIAEMTEKGYPAAQMVEDAEAAIAKYN